VLSGHFCAHPEHDPLKNNKMKTNINKLEKLVADYQQAIRGQVDKKKYTCYAITYHSTAIEGSTLTEGQIYNLLDQDIPAKNKPFTDGNGRMSRLLMNYLLTAFDLPILKNDYLCGMKKEVGKILIDIAKLVFAGVILAGLMRQDLSAVLLFVVGSTVTALSISIGLYLIWLDKKSNKENSQ
jgi:hypothetical protein